MPIFPILSASQIETTEAAGIGLLCFRGALLNFCKYSSCRCDVAEFMSGYEYNRPSVRFRYYLSYPPSTAPQQATQQDNLASTVVRIHKRCTCACGGRNCAIKRGSANHYGNITPVQSLVLCSST